MGIAAYNRGSAALSRRLDAEQRPATLRFMADVSAFSAEHGRIVPLAPTVIRFAPDRAGVSIMNKQAGGWASYAYNYPSIWSLAKAWRITLTGFGRDAHSAYFTVVPGPRKEL